MAVDPPYVCGAAPCVRCQPREIKPDHRARGEPRQARDAEQSNTPLVGDVCLLTTGVLIRVGRRNWYRVSDWHGFHDTWPSSRGDNAYQCESRRAKERLIFGGCPFT